MDKLKYDSDLKIQKLQSSLESKEKDIEDLNSELESANDVIANTSGALDNLKTEKAAVDAQLEDWKMKYQELNINFKHLTDKVLTLTLFIRATRTLCPWTCQYIYNIIITYIS